MKKLLTVCILTSGSVYTNISGQQEGQIKTERTSRKGTNETENSKKELTM